MEKLISKTFALLYNEDRDIALHEKALVLLFIALSIVSLSLVLAFL